MIIAVISNETNNNVQTHPENGSNVTHSRDINPGLFVIMPTGDVSSALVISIKLNRSGVITISQIAMSAV